MHICLQTNNLITAIYLRKLPPNPAATTPPHFCTLTVTLLCAASGVAINPFDTLQLQLSPRAASSVVGNSCFY